MEFSQIVVENYIMKIFKLTLVMGLFSLFPWSESSSQNSELIEITDFQDDDGWQDLVFTITEKELKNGYWNLKCQGKYKGIKVGFRVFIIEGIEPGIVPEGLDNSKFVFEAIQIESIGKESDGLIQIMSKLYGQPEKKAFTDKKLVFTVFPLNEQKAELEAGRFRFKLFYDDADEKGLYSEIYLNPNLPNSTIELKEKAEEYRENIIKAFSKN